MSSGAKWAFEQEQEESEAFERKKSTHPIVEKILKAIEKNGLKKWPEYYSIINTVIKLNIKENYLYVTENKLIKYELTINNIEFLSKYIENANKEYESMQKILKEINENNLISTLDFILNN